MVRVKNMNLKNNSECFNCAKQVSNEKMINFAASYCCISWKKYKE